jgi:hypothetical protein
MKYRVIYLTKSIEEKTCGLLIETCKEFNCDIDAIEFIKEIREKQLVTAPLLEVL